MPAPPRARTERRIGSGLVIGEALSVTKEAVAAFLGKKGPPIFR